MALFMTEGDLAKAYFREDELINLVDACMNAVRLARQDGVQLKRSDEAAIKYLEHFWYEVERYLETRDGFLDLEHLRQDVKEGASGS